MSDGSLEETLRRLRAEYIAEAPGRLAEIEDSLRELEAGSGTLKDLARLYHRLAGSGGSYGMDAVTTAARQGERLADDLADRGASPDAAAFAGFREAAEAIRLAFEAAAREEPPPSF